MSGGPIKHVLFYLGDGHNGREWTGTCEQKFLFSMPPNFFLSFNNSSLLKKNIENTYGTCKTFQ